MLAIYEIDRPPLPWDMRGMASKDDRKREAEDDALRIARRLAMLKPDDLSEREWTIRAGVSPSFFSNLRGRPTTGPSNPSAYQLKQMLDAIGVTRAEFFADEAESRVTLLPTKQALERLISAALPGRPRQDDRLAGYLAETVLGLLSLPPVHLRRLIETEPREADDVPHPATKRA